jgi:PBP1b-binding outer membrane lipoprotein LpoB
MISAYLTHYGRSFYEKMLMVCLIILLSLFLAGCANALARISTPDSYTAAEQA